MFTKTPAPKTELDDALTKALAELEVIDVTNENYGPALDRIVKLHKMKQESLPNRVSPDTWALVGANLAGIVMILSHEHAHVITSKALSFVLKPR
jgi:hypothetical protein